MNYNLATKIARIAAYETTLESLSIKDLKAMGKGLFKLTGLSKEELISNLRTELEGLRQLYNTRELAEKVDEVKELDKQLKDDEMKSKAKVLNIHEAVKSTPNKHKPVLFKVAYQEAIVMTVMADRPANTFTVSYNGTDNCYDFDSLRNYREILKFELEELNVDFSVDQPVKEEVKEPVKEPAKEPAKGDIKTVTVKGNQQLLLWEKEEKELGLEFKELTPAQELNQQFFMVCQNQLDGDNGKIGLTEDYKIIFSKYPLTEKAVTGTLELTENLIKIDYMGNQLEYTPDINDRYILMTEALLKLALICYRMETIPNPFPHLELVTSFIKAKHEEFRKKADVIDACMNHDKPKQTKVKEAPKAPVNSEMDALIEKRSGKILELADYGEEFFRQFTFKAGVKTVRTIVTLVPAVNQGDDETDSNYQCKEHVLFTKVTDNESEETVSLPVELPGKTGQQLKQEFIGCFNKLTESLR